MGETIALFSLVFDGWMRFRRVELESTRTVDWVKIP